MAYLFHPEIGPFYSLLLESVEATAGSLGVETTVAPVRALGDIERAISAIAAQPNSGIIVQPDGYTLSNRRFIIEWAARHRLPTIHDRRIEAAEGGLASYGADLLDLYRRCAAYVDRVLKGENPADLPVQQPLKYELVVNLKTAEALGLTIAETLLATADEVIQLRGASSSRGSGARRRGRWRRGRSSERCRSSGLSAVLRKEMVKSLSPHPPRDRRAGLCRWAQCRNLVSLSGNPIPWHARVSCRPLTVASLLFLRSAPPQRWRLRQRPQRFRSYL
jgi:hypothetical protein